MTIILTILGLCLFEVVSSIDNAVINADVLSTMQAKARRWFLIYGIIIAVFLIRWLLPWIIVYTTSPGLWFIWSFTATFSNDPHIKEIIESSSPVLLLWWWIFLIFLFFHWLFLEEKNYSFKFEKFFNEKWMWFYTIISIILSIVVWYALNDPNKMVAFWAVIWSTVYFITHGFKQNAEQSEKQLNKKWLSDMSKILYLEVIDATFSIDWVLWAFAFTLSVPLILIWNWLWAIVIRQLTVWNIERIKQYKYLKNWAMYSILFLGIIMILNAFKINIPEFLSPIITFLVIWYFFYKSIKELKVIH